MNKSIEEALLSIPGSIIALFTIMVSSCELDLLDNPNAVTSKNLDVNYLLNAIEINVSGSFDAFSGVGAGLTRILHRGGSVNYDNTVGPNTFSGTWNNSYANILIDIKNLIPVAESAGLFVHSGIAKTLRGYLLLTLVDFFGDIPYSEALDSENFNPKADAGKDLCGIFGLMVSAQRLATARPNTTKSSKELEPKRLAPCTDTQAASPMEYKPGTTLLGSPFFKVTTSPW